MCNLEELVQMNLFPGQEQRHRPEVEKGLGDIEKLGEGEGGTIWEYIYIYIYILPYVKEVIYFTFQPYTFKKYNKNKTLN